MNAHPLAQSVELLTALSTLLDENQDLVAVEDVAEALGAPLAATWHAVEVLTLMGHHGTWRIGAPGTRSSAWPPRGPGRLADTSPGEGGPRG